MKLLVKKRCGLPLFDNLWRKRALSVLRGLDLKDSLGTFDHLAALIVSLIATLALLR